MFQFKRPPPLDYVEVASQYGIKTSEQDVAHHFKSVLKKMNSEYPHFGSTSTTHIKSSQQWWCKVVEDTLKGILIKKFEH